ncbi:hypothetical protein ACFE04_007209 [Oxalis oulophora]
MDYILTPTLARLELLLSEEVKVLSGIEEEVKALHSKLISLQALLNQADAKEFATRDDELKSNLASIIDAAHDFEDAIDYYVLKSESTGGAFIKCLATFPDQYQVLTKIKPFIHHFDRFFQHPSFHAIQQYNKTSVSSEQGSSFPVCEIKQSEELEWCYKPPLAGHSIIRIEEKVEQVVDSLLPVRKTPAVVVAICGASGSGKTTLAKEVYHDAIIRRHFDYFAWVSFPHLIKYGIDYEGSESDAVDFSGYVCLQILRSLVSDSTGEEMDDKVKFVSSAGIISELDHFLRMNKCLVVIEEKLSSYGLVKCVLDLFQSGNFIWDTGSQFLLISSSDLVERRWMIVHEPLYFSSENAWKLLQIIITPMNDCPDIDMQLKTIGRNIAQHLNGCPWTIMLAGGLLAAKQCPIEWQKVDDKLILDRVCDQDPLQALFMLSYINLPTRLKACLFYLSQFPVEYEINLSRLVRIWVAEGFVSSREPETTKEGKTLEDLAERDLNELISRCLVLVGDRDADLRVKTCHLPETARSLCLSTQRLIQLESDATETDIESLCLSTKQRLIQLESDVTESDFSVHQYAHCYRFCTLNGAEVRSHLFFPGRNYGSFRTSYLNFDKHKLLRVLDLEEAVFGEESISKSIGELVHLRYLSLRHAKLSKIPSSLGNLKFLQTLDLLVEGKSLYIPDVIWKLNRLRHLFLPEGCDTKVKLRLDTLTKLRTLVNFPARNCDVKDLYIMTKLKELSICNAMSIRNFPRFSKLLGMRLKHLHKFSIHDNSREGDKGDEEQEI